MTLVRSDLDEINGKLDILIRDRPAIVRDTGLIGAEELNKTPGSVNLASPPAPRTTDERIYNLEDGIRDLRQVVLSEQEWRIWAVNAIEALARQLALQLDSYPDSALPQPDQGKVAI